MPSSRKRSRSQLRKSTSKTHSKSKSTRRRHSSSTQHDLDMLLQQQPEEKRPLRLKTLKWVGRGATKDVYRKGNQVYKYHVRRSTVTSFATPKPLIQKMEKLKLVIPEMRINDVMYSTEYCEPVYPDKNSEAVDVVRCNILLTLMADALVQHNIYAMDLHIGNIGRRPSDGHYFIIDNEGFFEAVSTKAQPNATMYTQVGATVNYFDLPHAQKCTWVSNFDAQYGWYAGGEKDEWAQHMVSYVAHMATITTIADLRLRNFVSHYMHFGEHMSYGLCLLPITKVYADATEPTRRAVDTFLTRYYQNRFIPYTSIDPTQPRFDRYSFGKGPAWMLDSGRRATFSSDIEDLAKWFVKQPMYNGIRMDFSKRKPTLWERVKKNGVVAIQVSVICGCMVVAAMDNMKQLAQKRKEKEEDIQRPWSL